MFDGWRNPRWDQHTSSAWLWNGLSSHRVRHHTSPITEHFSQLLSLLPFSNSIISDFRCWIWGFCAVRGHLSSAHRWEAPNDCAVPDFVFWRVKKASKLFSWSAKAFWKVLRCFSHGFETTFLAPEDFLCWIFSSCYPEAPLYRELAPKMLVNWFCLSPALLFSDSRCWSSSMGRN